MLLDNDEHMAYQEGNRLATTYSQLTLMAGSIFISAAFAIFGVSFTTIMEPSVTSFFLMGLSSCMLYAIFIVYNERYGKIVHKIIFPMLQQIEKKMDSEIQMHTKIHNSDQLHKDFSITSYTLRRIRFWNYLGFVVLILLWIVRIAIFCNVLVF